MVEPDARQDAIGITLTERGAVYRKAGLTGTKGLSLCPASDQGRSLTCFVGIPMGHRIRRW